MTLNYMITGACRGIGRGLSRSLLLQGHRVFLFDNNGTELEHMKLQLPKWLNTQRGHGQSDSRQYQLFHGDISRSSDRTAALTAAEEFFDGHLDVLINNAAFTSAVNSAKIDSDEFLDNWQKSIQINLTGTVLLTRACLPMLKKSNTRAHGGNIIMISSTRAYQSEPNSECYAATKAGLLGLSQALACSLAEDNIKVNAILPGWINVAHECKEGDESGATWKDGISEDDNKWHFAGRVGRVEDILRAVQYLSDAESFITGEEIKVDGGVTRRMVYPEEEKLVTLLLI